MGCLDSKQSNYPFSPNFTANLKALYEYYLSIVLFLRTQNLFASTSEKLKTLISIYLSNSKTFDKQDLALCAIDSVHKLHPLGFSSSKVTPQWLLQACLRQHKFISEFPIQMLKFQACKTHYLSFLRLCLLSKKTIVPNKLADFLWHSHMQDNLRYKMDTKNIFGNVLDHIDSYTQAQMKEHIKNTNKYTQEISLYPSASKKQTNRKDQHVSSKSNYALDESYKPIQFNVSVNNDVPIENYVDPNPIIPNNDSQDKCHKHQSHHHHHDHHNGHHHQHNDYHPQTYNSHYQAHNDYQTHIDPPCQINNNHHSSCGAVHHSSCGGAHHSSCGGGVSSCGGGHSSCGGGASSCGGGASSCGGGASSCGS